MKQNKKKTAVGTTGGFSFPKRYPFFVFHSGILNHGDDKVFIRASMKRVFVRHDKLSYDTEFNKNFSYLTI